MNRIWNIVNVAPLLWLLILVPSASTLNITTFKGDQYLLTHGAGEIICFITDVDCQVNGRLTTSAQGPHSLHVSEIGIRIATDKIVVSTLSDGRTLSVKLHDEEIPKTLTVKLAGGSLRRHHQKLTIKLEVYHFKISVESRTGLSLEAMYRPNPRSETSGALSESLDNQSVQKYLIKDGDLHSIAFTGSNFSVTDLWKQDYRMFREDQARTAESGWLIHGLIRSTNGGR